MKKGYFIEASELVFYSFWVRAENREEAENLVVNFNGDWEKHVVDSEDFQVTTLQDDVKIPRWVEKEFIVEETEEE